MHGLLDTSVAVTIDMIQAKCAAVISQSYWTLLSSARLMNQECHYDHDTPGFELVLIQKPT